MTDRQFVGIEIGGTKLQLALGIPDEPNQLKILPFKVDREAGGEGIRKQIQEHLPHLIKGKSVAGIGVGFGGPVDWRTGQICCSHQIKGWSEVDLAKWLKDLTGINAVIENDANTAALGEALAGAGKGFNPVFYVTLGSGVGGGLVYNGEVFHGRVPGEAEIGHIRLDKAGAIVEERCSGWAVDRKIRAAVKAKPHSELTKLVGMSIDGEAKFLSEALTKNDPDARKIFDETVDDLAFGLSHVAHLFHPEVIIIGGGLSHLGQLLRGAVEEALPRYLMKAFHPGPRIKLAELGEKVVPVGALLLAEKAFR